MTMLLTAAGFVILAGVAIVAWRSRQFEYDDSVPHHVLTRINLDYRDIH